MTLLFGKKDDVHLKLLSGERHEERALLEHFIFEVEGAKFDPRVKNGWWDGKIRLYNSNTREIYLGLIDDIIKFGKEMDIDVQFNFNIEDQTLDDSIIDGFLTNLNPKNYKGEPITFHEHQYNAVKIALRKQKCLLLSPTASGKSLIIYALTRWWLKVHSEKILIIVPNISLVTQLMKDFQEYSGGSFTDMQGIMSGMTKEATSRVVVSTWQSIFNQPKEWYEQFSSVIVDEVHTAQAKSLRNIMEKLVVCPDKVGLSGTFNELQTHELVLRGLFGNIFKVISTKELMDDNKVAKMKIEIIQFEYPEDARKQVSKMDYQTETEFLINHPYRNDILAKMAVNCSGPTLVIFQRIEHGKALFELIKSKTNRTVVYISGETDKDKREFARQLTREEDVILVASLGVFSTGINAPALRHLIFAHPFKSKIKVLQSIGRILRISDDKVLAKVYDIVDNLVLKSRKNFAYRHAAERFKYYLQESFEYTLHNIVIKK